MNALLPAAIQDAIDSAQSAELQLEKPERIFSGMNTITREEIDAKLDASAARTEKAFAEMKAEISGLRGDFNATFASVPSHSFLVGTAVAIVAAVVGIMALGATQFGNGVMVTTVAVQDAAEARRISQESAAEVRALRDEIGSFLQTIQNDRAQPAPPQFEPLPAPSNE